MRPVRRFDGTARLRTRRSNGGRLTLGTLRKLQRTMMTSREDDDAASWSEKNFYSRASRSAIRNGASLLDACLAACEGETRFRASE